MEPLLKALSEFVAAILGLVGFVGRSRRRESIHEDLRLLEQLRESPDFGEGSSAHRHLLEHVGSEVAVFVGATRRRKKRNWGSIVLALFLGVPLAYWTYTIVNGGFRWYALFPGVVGGLFLLVAVSMAIQGEEVAGDEQDAGDSKRAADPARENCTGGAYRDSCLKKRRGGRRARRARGARGTPRARCPRRAGHRPSAIARRWWACSRAGPLTSHRASPWTTSQR